MYDTKKITASRNATTSSHSDSQTLPATDTDRKTKPQMLLH